MPQRKPLDPLSLLHPTARQALTDFELSIRKQTADVYSHGTNLKLDAEYEAAKDKLIAVILRLQRLAKPKRPSGP